MRNGGKKTEVSAGCKNKKNLPASGAADGVRSDIIREFRLRTGQFLSFGHDRIAAARFVAEAVGFPAGPVLDVGTGKGLLAVELARSAPQVVTVDSSPDDREIALLLAGEECLSEKITFLQRDAASLPFPDDHFAACATMDALHHLQDGGAVLSEMVRVLKPGGTVVVAEFDSRGFEIVGRIHREEGRTHQEGPVTSAWADGYLEGLGLSRAGRLQGHQHLVSVFRKPEAEAGSGCWSGTAFARMGKGELLRAIEVFAKNWLTHDGCWFLAAEEKLGTGAAIELDTKSWERFSAAEAARIMAAFNIKRDGGLEALARVLELRMYALINPQKMEWSKDRSRLSFVMESCRVQDTRRRKGLPDFPCKPVGLVEFSGFAKAIDPRIQVRCLSCPPDSGWTGGCAWEFSIENEAGL